MYVWPSSSYWYHSFSKSTLVELYFWIALNTSSSNRVGKCSFPKLLPISVYAYCVYSNCVWARSSNSSGGGGGGDSNEKNKDKKRQTNKNTKWILIIKTINKSGNKLSIDWKIVIHSVIQKNTISLGELTPNWTSFFSNKYQSPMNCKRLVYEDLCIFSKWKIPIQFYPILFPNDQKSYGLKSNVQNTSRDFSVFFSSPSENMLKNFSPRKWN